MDYKKLYEDALERAKNLENTTTEEDALIKYIFPELRESEDERIRSAMMRGFNSMLANQAIGTFAGEPIKNILSYLEKQKKCLADNSKTSNSEDERIRKWLYEYINAHNWRNDYTVSKEEALDYLEKQKEKKDYRKLYEDITKSEWFKKSYVGKSLGENPYDFAMSQQEKQKEQNLRLTVRGDGCYKICPHCKSRMIRDDSKVYTSKPPQYGYNCPKCGTIEYDTVMYDSPEMEEQKPVERSEDERMRRKAIEYITLYSDEYGNWDEIKEVIAWLEMQKDASKAIEAVDRIDKYIDENTANAHDMKDSHPDKKYYSGVDDTLSGIAGILEDVYSEEKQKEQKPSEDEGNKNSK